MLRKEMTFLPSHKATTPKFHVLEEPFYDYPLNLHSPHFKRFSYWTVFLRNNYFSQDPNNANTLKFRYFQGKQRPT